MSKTFLIFDFDGTLAQTLDAIVKILRPMAKEFGLGQINDENINQFKEKGTRQIIKELKAPLIKIPTIVKRVKDKLDKEIENLSSFDGIKETLNELKERGYVLGILTSNSQKNVKKFLRKNGFDFFDFIYADSSFFGKDKVLKKLLQNRNLKTNQVVYFGDEVRDIQAALKLKIKVVAVSWGFNTKRLLASYKPTYLVENPSQILHLFSQP